MDLITFDSTVEVVSAVHGAAAANGSAPQRRTLIEAGFLTALRDPQVIEAARVYGDPVALLETET